MNIPDLMIEELNNKMDLLEQTAIRRREVLYRFLSMLDEKNAIIEDLNDKIGQLQRAIKHHCH